jgi:PKD repeat protein
VVFPMRFSTILLTAVMLSATFAGCSSDKGPATADFVATAANADKSSYKFDASNSSGDALTYTWDFGDQSAPGSGVTAEHTYQYLNGQYSVKLTVTGADGTTSEKVQKVQVGTGQNTEPKLYLTTDKRWIAPGESVTFDATQSVDEDGDPLFFHWDFNDMRDQSSFNDMENLGSQQYGIYKKGPPASGASASGGNATNDTGGGLMLTPSGYDWNVEYAKAQERAKETQKRVWEFMGVSTFDGNHSVAPEPRNDAFDGKTTDTGPIQIMTFPDPATYFVHVQATDIKGTFAEGFIRINVDPNVPETSFSNESTADIAPSSLQGALESAGGAPGPKAFHSVQFSATYPAVYEITMTYEPQGGAGSPVPSKVGGYVCGASVDSGGCKTKDTKMVPWESGATYLFQMKANMVGGYQALFATVEDGGTPSGGATITVSITGTIFPNKWYKEEAGLGH